MYLKPLHLPKASILVLEEDPFLRNGLVNLLHDAGYRIAEDRSHEHGVGEIDLVLANVDAHPALQRLDGNAPVILLVDHAAWSGLDFLDVANDCGAVAVLPRPFSRAALLRVLADVLSQPARDPAPSGEADLPGVGDLLVCLHNPNFV